jgi:hypothetical protein
MWHPEHFILVAREVHIYHYFPKEGEGLMNRLWQTLEDVLSKLILAILLIVSLGETLGIFNILPNSIFPTLTASLVILQLGWMRVIHAHLLAIKRDMENNERYYDMSYLYLRLDEGLRRAIGDPYLHNALQPYQTALKEHTVYLNGSDVVACFRNTLSNFPTETFISSVTLQTIPFWLNDEVSKICTGFIEHGGTIRQVFFVTEAKEETLPAVKDFCAQQKLKKIDVVIVALSALHNVNTASLQRELRENLLIGLESNIKWEFSVNNGSIDSGIVTTDVAKVEQLRQILTNAYTHASVHKKARPAARKR